ncbi:MAG: hypothetical protein K1X64_10485 [Myxococcaceae bacterium]|nr:hypothetical protein [Myxococcaceae bacterium]
MTSRVARWALWSFLPWVAACAHERAGQGGAKFRSVATEAPRVPLEKVVEVCWPADAGAAARLVFTRMGSEWMFEVQNGASNSTGRCVRELLAAHPASGQAASPMELRPPALAPSGWAVLAYVRLLSPGRFDDSRGLLDPAPLVSACLKRGMGLRKGALFDVVHVPVLKISVLADGGEFNAATDTERCVEAVLGSTAWPNTRAFRFDFTSREGAPEPAGDVDGYFGRGAAVTGVVDPQVVKDALSARMGGIGLCWETALTRRAGLAGGRSMRLNIDQEGQLSSVAVVANVSNQPRNAADYLLDQCLFQQVRAARFPPGGGSAVYSWVFADRAAQ